MGIQFDCVNCGKTFSIPPSVAKRRADHACSLSCARSFWKNKKRAGVTKTCEMCNGDYYVPQCRSGISRFCSDNCKNEFQQGENHPSWVGRGERPWEWRQVIIDKMKVVKKCEICDSTDRLCGHHVKPTSTHPELGGDIGNILILCTPCHAKQHPKQEALLLSRR